MLIADILRKLRSEGSKATFARGAIGVFLVNCGGTALTVIAQLALARFLGTAEYGIYVYALTCLGFLSLFGIWGMDTAALRFVPAYKGKGDGAHLFGFLRFSSQATLGLSLLLAGLAGGLVWVFRGRFGAEKSVAFGIACLLLPLNCLLQLAGAYLQGFKKVVPSQFLQSVLRPVLLIIALGFARLFFRGPLNATIAMVLNVMAAVATLLLLYRFLYRVVGAEAKPSANQGSRREWLAASSSFFVISASQVLLSQTDILLIGMFLDTTQSGIYAVSSRIATLITFGITSINSILAPTISELHARSRHQELQAAVTLAARGVLIYSVPMVCFLWVGGKWLLGLFGADFTQGYPVLVVLSIGQLVIALAGSVGFLMTMTGHQREAMGVIVGSALVSIILNLSFIPYFGMLGAATATMVAISVRSLVLSFLVKQRLNILSTAIGLARVQAQKD